MPNARQFFDSTVPNPLNILTRTTWTDQPKRAARVYVADGVLRVFVASTGQPPIEILEETSDVSVERVGRKYRITRPDGSVIEVEKQGCGCSSPLKSFQPAKWEG